MNTRRYLSTILTFGALLALQPARGQVGSTTGNDIPPVITYQGMIAAPGKGAVPDRDYSITVTLYGDGNGTEQVWRGTYTTPVRNGLFDLDLGSGAYPLPAAATMDRPLWAGVGIDGGREMGPLTRLSASPFAMNVADNAVTSDKIASGAVTAEKVDMDYVSEIRINGEKVSGRGTALNIMGEGIAFDPASGSVTISREAGESSSTSGKQGAGTLGTNSDFWTLQGDGRTDNGGVVTPTNTDWIGTSDPAGAPTGADFTIKVNGEQIMRYQANGTNTPNVVGGNTVNSVSAGISGSVIAGGGATGLANTVKDDYGFIGGGADNLVDAGGDYNTIGGGSSNTIDGTYSFIGGGSNQTLETDYGVIAGGDDNVLQSTGGAIGGGVGHVIGAFAQQAVIGGGNDNQVAPIGPATANYGTVGGGYRNVITRGDASTIPGGDQLTAQSYAQTVLGFKNRAAGAVPLRPPAAVIAATNSPLVIVGNGDVAAGVASNAFEISYNGHSTVFDVNGPRSTGTRDPIKGSTYVDNIVYAWGYVSGAPAVITDFGVSGITALAPGCVRVVIKVVDPVTGAQVALTGASVTATLVDLGGATSPITCGTITTSPIAPFGADLNTFVVKTANNCTMAYRPFMFKVTGR